MNEDLLRRLLGAQQRMAAHSTLHTETIARQLGSTPTDVKCLSLLVLEPMTPRRIADELHLTAGAGTTVIDRLEKAGYARRERTSADRRQVTVQADLEKAQAAIALYTPLYERTRALVERYDEAQLAFLVDYVEKMTDILASSSDA